MVAGTSGLATLGFAACGGGTTSPPASKSLAPINVGFVTEASGAYGAVFGTSVQGAQAEVNAVDKHGGIDGHMVHMKVYDTTSAASGAQNATRSAVGDGVLGIVSASQFIDGALPSLASQAFPVVGFGVSPNWYGSSANSLFSYNGNIMTETSSMWGKVLIDLGDSEIAVVADATAGSQAAFPTWKALVPSVGGHLVGSVSPVNVSDSAELTAAANRIIQSGAQGVLATVAGGGEQLESALNQLGHHIPVVQGATYGPAVVKQLGTAADGLIYGSFYASLQHADVPGVVTYLADMKAAGDDPTSGMAVQGYIGMKMFLDAVAKAEGSSSAIPSRPAVVRTLNSLNGYNEGGLIAPVHFPAFHTQGSGCLSFSQIQNGQWKPLTKQAFECGKLFS